MPIYLSIYLYMTYTKYKVLETFKALNAMRLYSYFYWLVIFNEHPVSFFIILFRLLSTISYCKRLYRSNPFLLSISLDFLVLNPCAHTFINFAHIEIGKMRPFDFISSSGCFGIRQLQYGEKNKNIC